MNPWLAALGLLVRVTPRTDGRVESVKILGIPLFFRPSGKARVLGIRAKRLD